ncbi:MAG: type II toxin-antitoxin system RelE/ParE family toxin [Candidatus Omnitrophota bacterium]|nr:type II toxin-antitoxin system RelE/ParE family toxin [Candidatus Omnitrophota bacterium]
MELIFSRSAFRQLSSLEKNVQKRIAEKLDFYLSQKDPVKFAEKLRDSYFGEWRFRIGDHRVIFDVEDDKIIVLKIGHRRNVYR